MQYRFSQHNEMTEDTLRAKLVTKNYQVMPRLYKRGAPAPGEENTPNYTAKPIPNYKKISKKQI